MIKMLQKVTKINRKYQFSITVRYQLKKNSNYLPSYKPTVF